MFKKIAIAAAVATTIGGFANNAVAGSTTSNVPVSATVLSKCNASATTVNFGNYDPIQTTSDYAGTGTVLLTCTKAAAVTVALDLGAQPTGSTRRMKNGSDFLVYELYLPTANTAAAACPTLGTGTIWNATNTLAPSATWDAATQFSFNVCGFLGKNQNVSGSSTGLSYTDTVIATITF